MATVTERDEDRRRGKADFAGSRAIDAVVL